MYGRTPAVTTETLLVLDPFGNFLVESESGPCTQRAGGDRRKSQETPGWQVAVFISKRAFCLRLVLGGSKKS